jgi:Raf kinase inhibitor-like YbhB/YbcL family protein
MGHALPFVALVMLAACGGGGQAIPTKSSSPPAAIGHFTVSSPDLPGLVPRQFTCDGGNHVPRLQWTSYPVKEWALEMVDPDAPGGSFVHWVVYAIPAGITSVGAQPPAGALEGKNSRGQAGYTGPCPPPGPAHHYHFVVFGLDAALGLGAGLSRSELDAKMSGHVVATGELVATYQR